MPISQLLTVRRTVADDQICFPPSQGVENERHSVWHGNVSLKSSDTSQRRLSISTNICVEVPKEALTLPDTYHGLQVDTDDPILSWRVSRPVRVSVIPRIPPCMSPTSPESTKLCAGAAEQDSDNKRDQTPTALAHRPGTCHRTEIVDAANSNALQERGTHRRRLPKTWDHDPGAAQRSTAVLTPRKRSNSSSSSQNGPNAITYLDARACKRIELDILGRQRDSKKPGAVGRRQI